MFFLRKIFRLLTWKEFLLDILKWAWDCVRGRVCGSDVATEGPAEGQKMNRLQSISYTCISHRSKTIGSFSRHVLAS